MSTASPEIARVPYGQKSQTWVDRFGVWLSSRAIDRSVADRTGLRVIEFGSGYHARHLCRLQPRLSEGVAVDYALSPELNQLPGLRTMEMPIEAALPTLPENHFDLILLISVLEHLPTPAEALASMFRLLAPGGTLLVNVPTWRGKIFLELTAFRLGLSPKDEMDDHKMYYDLQDLWPLLIRAGFKPSKLSLRRHKFGLNLFARAVK